MTDAGAHPGCNITIVRLDITRANTDAIVNAANEDLRPGGGVCSAIFAEAGHRDMLRACKAIGHCDTGSAVVTPGFALKAHYVIHAVGPIWYGGGNGEPELLASCYRTAIELAVANDCKSIAFPLISAGIFGYPKEDAWRVAISSCLEKLAELGDDTPSVQFCVLDEAALALGERMLAELASMR